MLQIRPATESDVAAITDIYNEAILNTSATFDTEIKHWKTGCSGSAIMMLHILLLLV
jgi:L-amino acid N-acyltransferase YncA